MSPLALSLHFLQAQPDSRLITLAREGHEPAFEALVRRYRRELLAYCRRLQPRSGSAEDALQQTFLQAWRALRAGAEVWEARAWLYRIAHNVTLNHLRVAVAVPQEVSEAAGGEEVHQLVEQRLQARAALAGMASLPALQRDVFVSTTLNGASHEEVASALGLSSGAVRGLIYRARATLRSAAAAVTPSPALHWAIRRVESRSGGAGAIAEALAGGGSAGVAAAIAKGGAVLTLAGAVAGAGGVIAAHSSSHHRHVRRADRSVGARAHRHGTRTAEAVDELVMRPVRGEARDREERSVGRGSDASGERGRNSGLRGEEHRGSSGEERGAGSEGSDNGSRASSTNRSDEGSGEGATSARDGSSGSGAGGASGGSDGGSDGSSGGSSSTTSGSDGGSSGSGSGDQTLTTATSADGGSGSDGGSSGSGKTTITTTANLP